MGIKMRRKSISPRFRTTAKCCSVTGLETKLFGLVFLFLRRERVGVLQNRGQVRPSNNAGGMVEQSPGVDRRVIGEDASLKQTVDTALGDPCTAGKIGGADLGSADLGAIKRCRIPVTLPVPRHFCIVSEGSQCGLGGGQRLQRNVNA